jgi:hypothetical protein
MTVRCPWCNRPFRPRTSGGSDQRFCRSACRTAFWSAARRWVMRALQAGLLSTDVLKSAQNNLSAVAIGPYLEKTTIRHPATTAASMVCSTVPPRPGRGGDITAETPSSRRVFQWADR